jgi:hypothetical protein
MACGLLVGRTWGSRTTRVYAQGTSPAPDVVVPEGRFQLAHVYFDSERQATMMIDSHVGRVYLLVTGRDKNGNPTQAFQQLPISSCMDLSCSEFNWHLHPELDAGPGPRATRD